jgi:hypothetical protein
VSFFSTNNTIHATCLFFFSFINENNIKKKQKAFAILDPRTAPRMAAQLPCLAISPGHYQQHKSTYVDFYTLDGPSYTRRIPLQNEIFTYIILHLVSASSPHETSNRRKKLTMNTATSDDPDFNAFLAKLTPAERAEAIAAAAAAKRAEERAEQRELERAIREKEEQRRREKQREDEERNRHSIRGIGGMTAAIHQGDVAVVGTSTEQQQQRLVYIPKRKREQIESTSMNEGSSNGNGMSRYPNGDNKKSIESSQRSSSSNVNATTAAGKRMDDSEPVLTTKERLAVVQTYLGKSATEALVDTQPQQPKKKQLRMNKKATFKFRWDETDDTSNFDDPDDPIYAPLYSHNNNNNTNRRTFQPTLNRQSHKMKGFMGGEVSSMVTVMEKPIDQMTPRDWRILRENFEITVRGGQAPPPMRRFTESPAPYLPPIHPALLDAITNVFQFQDPSPIQRQAIPIGLQRRDLIGISETGSGKTIAFGVPMCHYLLNLPNNVLQSVADQGPLAIVMAPTRELAIQIELELSKLLSRQRLIQSTVVVGGQPIQQQAQAIRRGVHIIVGTPGRINDCIEMAYLVLNQCCYIIMDEADRMIDMGFAPQMESMYVLLLIFLSLPS